MRSYVILAVMILLVIFGCENVKIGAAAKSSDKVKSYVVKEGRIVVKLEETGEIQPFKEIDIKSKISGKILKFFVEVGDYVNLGDVIAEIEPDYNQSETITRIKSNLEIAELNLKNAESELQNKQKLFEQNFISSKDLENYEDAYTKAQINYRTSLLQYESIKEIESEGNISRIISSATGTVIEKPVEEGEMVVSSFGSYSAGTVIVTLADLERLVVKSRINEVDIGKISKDQLVDIQVDAYPYVKYQGFITSIAAKAITYNNVKVFPIDIVITDVDEKIKPGMTANVTIIGEEKKNILVVPIRTIFSSEDNRDIVYRVKNDTIADPVYVKTGINNFQEVEIIEGLALGDSISFSEPVKDEKDFQFNF
jgi:HlyD family secretion protein